MPEPPEATSGRKKVPVTLLPSKRHPWERQVEMDVSPHLKIRTPLAEITPRAMTLRVWCWDPGRSNGRRGHVPAGAIGGSRELAVSQRTRCTVSLPR